jgi:hypothetical protein
MALPVRCLPASNAGFLLLRHRKLSARRFDGWGRALISLSRANCAASSVMHFPLCRTDSGGGICWAAQLRMGGFNSTIAFDA